MSQVVKNEVERERYTFEDGADGFLTFVVDLSAQYNEVLAVMKRIRSRVKRIAVLEDLLNNPEYGVRLEIARWKSKPIDETKTIVPMDLIVERDTYVSMLGKLQDGKRL